MYPAYDMETRKVIRVLGAVFVVMLWVIFRFFRMKLSGWAWDEFWPSVPIIAGLALIFLSWSALKKGLKQQVGARPNNHQVA